MCGRYHFDILPDKKGKQIKQRVEQLNLVFKQGEIFPTDKVLCIIPKNNKVDLCVKNWGIKSKSLLINARIETIDDRITYKSIRNNRCAVVCNGFYEWDKDKNKYIIKTNDDYIYLACIFNENDELVIITTSSKGEFTNIHDRMPMIMNQEEMLHYINSEDYVFSDKKLLIEQVNDELKLF